LLQNFGAERTHDFRVRAGIDRTAKSVNAQVAALKKHGAGKVFREVASGAKTDRTQLRRVIDSSAPATC
jgi:hypothetical protein